MKATLFKIAHKLLFSNKRLPEKTSYSQEAEDLVLFEIAQFKNSYKGLYVDVGAHHPFRFSNTAIYYQRGWRGINIDATPQSMNEFRKFRPEDINLECAVSLDSQERFFYVYNEPALNGIDNDRTSQFEGSKYILTEKIRVKTRTLKSILGMNYEQLPKPNFLSVDVEGHELEVLKSNDWDRYCFEWILCELKIEKISDLGHNPVYQYLADLGFHLKAFTGRTGIFCMSKFRNS
jgi:FkbM family methyltransferase